MSDESNSRERLAGLRQSIQRESVVALDNSDVESIDSCNSKLELIGHLDRASAPAPARKPLRLVIPVALIAASLAAILSLTQPKYWAVHVEANFNALIMKLRDDGSIDGDRHRAPIVVSSYGGVSGPSAFSTDILEAEDLVLDKILGAESVEISHRSIEGMVDILVIGDQARVQLVPAGQIALAITSAGPMQLEDDYLSLRNGSGGQLMVTVKDGVLIHKVDKTEFHFAKRTSNRSRFHARARAHSCKHVL